MLATLKRSSSVNGGKMLGKRCANIDLPVPGGPIINRLCPPAAATSKARRALYCPLTSLKSAKSVKSKTTSTGITASSNRTRFKCAATLLKLSAAYTLICSNNAACSALSLGNTNARCDWAHATAMAKAPRMGRKRPERASSPANSYCATSSAMI